MKLYEYDELKKLNQAMSSFKRNGIPVEKVELVVIENKVLYFVLTNPPVREIKKEDKTEKPKKEIESKAKVEKPKEDKK
jgi:hypothetical protein